MIYDCPKCQTPQEAGRTSCPHCQTEFDGPVPDDAIMPLEEAAPDISPTLLVAESDATTAEEKLGLGQSASLSEKSEPIAAEPEAEPLQDAAEPLPTVTEVTPEPIQEVKPPPVRPDSQPYLTAPTYTPPPYVPPLAAPQPLPQTSSAGLSRLLLIALPVVLVLVLGGFFYAHSLNSDSGSSEIPPSVTPASSAPLPTATPVAAPVSLQGSLSTDAARNDPQIKMLIGRWEAKSSDYYVFNNDGTGSRGSIIGSQKNQPFLWNLVQKRLMLYGDTNDKLRFNPGPDADTIFLRGDSGRYIQYTRTKT